MWFRRILLAVLGCVIFGVCWCGAQDLERIVRENEGVVLVVTGIRADTGAPVQGSGIFIHTQGYVLVTAHQVMGVAQLEGRLHTGESFPLEIVEIDAPMEMALLKAAKTLAASARYRHADGLYSGAPLVSIAAPMNLDFSTVSGTVSNPNRTYRGYRVIQAVLAASHGSSGGPVFDRTGALVGLISGQIEEAGFTIINRIDNAFPLLRRHGIAVPESSFSEDPGIELSPVPGVSEREVEAIEAYNRGVATADPASKCEAYGQAVRLLPDFYEAWFNLGVAASRSGDPALAIEAYERAAALRPEAPEAARNLGRVYLSSGQYGEALACFVRARDLAPGLPQSYNDLGETYRKMERLEKAEQAFQEALAIDPAYAPAHYNLALVYVRGQRDKDAIGHFERYLELRPDAPDAEEVRTWIAEWRRP
jgi:tetratricopeptide (TPR) repeat protein